MVGAIADAEGRILVTKRPDHVHQGGLWEFPGGKLESGERPEQGLRRELAEELGIQVRASRPLIRVQHDYGDRQVLLDVHRVEDYCGVPAGCEGQPLDWLHPDAMEPSCFPAADRPIINALRLPAVLLITGDGADRPNAFIERLGCALADGVRLVQLRAHGLSDAKYSALAARAHALCESHQARLLLNRDPDSLGDVSRHGLHLTTGRLMGLEARPGRAGELVGASCHSARQLARACELGLDYAVLSPVKPTASHPEAAPLGWEGFASLVEPAGLPVYALGGLSPADLAAAFTHGAQGVAAIRGLWPA
ncbi:thiamine monophosphate synthase [Thiocystis violacea]|nr:thiamine monophosphate synthase [Thiocystis violacea]